MKILRLAPLEKQDRLEGGFLLTENGNYFDIDDIEFYRGGVAISPSHRQELLKDGRILSLAGYYYNLNDMEGIKEKRGGCFVATAVYGDRNAPQVQTLRKIKEQVFERSLEGQVLTNFYYSGAGKRTADVIKKYFPFTIPVFRKCLDVVVDRWSSSQRGKR